MRCPTCDRNAAPDADTCPAGHVLADDAGVIRLLPADLRDRVAALEAAVTVWRREQGRMPLPAPALRDLPFGEAVRRDHEWKLRRADLSLVRRLLHGRRSAAGGALRILDVGAWNGWLSARLASDGHAATALDLFAGPDALGARHQLPGDWRAVQADPTDLGRLGDRFDVVILDRCLSFQPDPAAAVRGAVAVTEPGGVVIATGLTFPGDPELAATRLEAERAAFRVRCGTDLLLRPARGVLTEVDAAELSAAGMRLRDHPFLRIANIRARVDAGRPRHRYGTQEVGG